MDKKLLESYIEFADHGVILIDNLGNVILWNRWVERHARIKRADAIGKPVADVFRLDPQSRLAQAIAGALHSGQSAILSQAFHPHPLPLFRMGTKDDRMTQKIVVQSRLLPDKNRFCFLEIIDFSASTQREKYLSQANKEIAAQKANLLNAAKLSALGEMAGGIAHEINNPLAIIQTAIRRVMSTLDKQDLREQKTVDKISKYATTINETVGRIAKIVKGMRTISRSEKIDSFDLVEVSQLIEDTLGLCSEKFRSQGVDLEVHCNAGQPIIECSVVQVSQAVLNLLNNAFDAVCDSPEKWIRIEINGLEDNNIEIAVSDSGPGVPRNVRDKILEPFFTTKEIGRGTGLGLGITKSIIDNHGGQLYLDEQSLETRFVIILPKTQSHTHVA